jgi:transposase
MNAKEKLHMRIYRTKSQAKSCKDIERIAKRFGVSSATIRRVWKRMEILGRAP